MKIVNKRQTILSISVISIFTVFAVIVILSNSKFTGSLAQTTPTPDGNAKLNQWEASAKLREQIKGREKEPAGNVFKNIQTLKQIPAGNFLAIMEVGFSRSLGTDCTHCHTPEKWEAETKPQKQIAREMWTMVG